MTIAIYNEIDPFTADWLESLIGGGHVAPGKVDRRSIEDLQPSDVAGNGQRHFFGGIGGWSLACRLAGISDDASVWTGSCPCQPFSHAGQRDGFDDERHLWPAWFELIRECRPATIFGEQVASASGFDWLDGVRADLEGSGYAVGASDLCAAGVGAPHIRQRIYFVAYALEGGCAKLRAPRLHDHRQCGDNAVGRGEVDVWRTAELRACRDETTRSVEPGSFPLAYGVPAHVGKLRAYGNAIVAPLAAVFIRSALDAIDEVAQFTVTR